MARRGVATVFADKAGLDVLNLDHDALRSLDVDELIDLVRALAAGPNAIASVQGTPASNGLVNSGGTASEIPNEQTGQPGSSEPYMVGNSEALRKVFNTIRRFAVSDAPVLITGESGTGKELAARAIHERSAFAAGPFVPINCGGLPSSLIASELFGYEKGAFTGATHRQIGLIESAAGGVVFLDEIGDLPVELQPHLLRFLQERSILRIGGRRPIPVRVRIIAATNQDLNTAIQYGSFREDLYYRLDILRLEIPPLRARTEDIELLAMFFLRMFSSEMGRSFLGFDRQTLAALNNHSWPGNIRELIGRVRRAVVMAEGERISPVDLGFAEFSEQAAGTGPSLSTGAMDALPGNGQGVAPLKQLLSDCEAVIVRDSLSRNGGKVQRAAGELGVSRVTLYRLMEKHGIGPKHSAPNKAVLNER